MTKTVKKSDRKTALDRDAVQPLTITAIIPAKAVPLFQAMIALHRTHWTQSHYKMVHKRAVKIGETIPTESEIVSRALMRWMTCEEAMNVLDKAVSNILNESASE